MSKLNQKVSQSKNKKKSSTIRCLALIDSTHKRKKKCQHPIKIRIRNEFVISYFVHDIDLFRSAFNNIAFDEMRRKSCDLACVRVWFFFSSVLYHRQNIFWMGEWENRTAAKSGVHKVNKLTWRSLFVLNIHFVVHAPFDTCFITLQRCKIRFWYFQNQKALPHFIFAHSMNDD